MHIAVFLKRILDPGIPVSKLRIASGTKDATADGVAYVMGPYDENAIETALQLKSHTPGARVTAISYGPPQTEELLRRALAVGIDDAVLVADEGGVHDAFHVGAVLAATVQTLDDVAVCLFGLQSGDWDSGQTPYVVAEELGWTAVATVAGIEPAGDALLLRRLSPLGVERVRVRGRVVASVVSDGANALRIAKVKDVLTAKRKTIGTRTLAGLGVTATDRTEIESLAPSAHREARCMFVAGDDPAAKACALVDELAARKLV